jgi:hypothetical protein
VETKRPELDAEFIAALMGEDELGVVIRAHTHIEASLNELLDIFVVTPKFLHDANLSYGQKVRLAGAHGLKKHHVPPLLAMGKIRNQFAHKLNAKLTKERVSELYASFAPEDRKVLHLSYHDTKSKMLIEKGPDFRKLEPKDQFILMAVSLKALVAIAVHHLKQRANLT